MIAFNHLGRNGRLGNQMFQYAALRGIAAAKGYEFCIPPSDFSRPYKDHQLFDLFALPHLKVRKKHGSSYLPERVFHYDEEFARKCPDEVSLFGFFQTERYFAHIADSLREDFAFQDAVVAPCRTRMRGLRDPIALHVRRTDYLQQKDKHLNLRGRYYARALDRFADDRTVLVFSDDTEWCRQQPFFQRDRFVIPDTGSNKLDLCMMSLCSGHIIANSSFSWWGAWLAGTTEVVAPDQWFAPADRGRDTRDLIPARWQTAPVE